MTLRVVIRGYAQEWSPSQTRTALHSSTARPSLNVTDSDNDNDMDSENDENSDQPNTQTVDPSRPQPSLGPESMTHLGYLIL